MHFKHANIWQKIYKRILKTLYKSTRGIISTTWSNSATRCRYENLVRQSYYINHLADQTQRHDAVMTICHIWANAAHYSQQRSQKHSLNRYLRLIHWNGDVVILTKFPSLTALEVVTRQLPVQPVMEISISSKWRHFRFSVTLGFPYQSIMHQQAKVLMMVADVLAPYMRQVISNTRGDSAVNTM